MRHVTTDTLYQDNSTYRSFLEAENITLKEGDVLVNKFIGTSKRVGTTTADKAFPLLNPESTIYLLPNELPGIEGLDITNETLRKPWNAKSVKVRVLGDKPLIIKGNPASSYAPVRLLGPNQFDCDFRNNLLGKRAFVVDCNGFLKNHALFFSADGNADVKFCGWKVLNGGFTARIFQNAVTSVVSGVIEDFEVEGIMSEGLYIGSIKELHTIFKNFHVRNGKFINVGSEFIQAQNFGEGCTIENHTVINTACQFPSPFQPNQVGSMQIKAGGGSFKIRNIYIEQGGEPVINLFAAAPVYVNGVMIQEGAKPGDVVEFDNIHCPSAKGNFLYIHSSCNNGTHWVFDNIHAGGVTKRISADTGKSLPYAFLYDVPLAATDQVTIRNISTDKSLPLVGKSPRYTIENHVVVDSIPKAKFVKPMPEGDVFSYYQLYNQVSQGQFYPLAGQPVKYKAGDLVYFDQVGKQRTWFRSDKDQLATSLTPGEGFTPIEWDADYTILPEVDPKDEIIEELKAQNDLLNTQLIWANTLTEEYRVKLVNSIAENDTLKTKVEQVKQIVNG
jgi:hypothetical protein